MTRTSQSGNRIETVEIEEGEEVAEESQEAELGIGNGGRERN